MKAQQFGRKLNEAIKLIAHHQRMTMSGVVLKLAEELYISPYTLNNWRYGRRLPASDEDTRALIEALWELTALQRDHFDRAWFREFLDSIEYPESEAFLDERFPEENPSVSEVELIPPPTLETVPRPTYFVGREAELTRGREWLQRQHYLVLTGMAGTGKTSYAAHLVSTLPFKDWHIFWYTLRQNEDPRIILWHLAAFLAHLGDPVIWRIIQSPSHPPENILLSAMLERLRRERVILCFDDYHLAEQETFYIRLIQPLFRSLSEALKLILISRHFPKHLPVFDVLTLSGLDKQAAAQLIEQHGLALSPSEFERLYRTSQGNPQLLLLAIAVLKRGRDIALLDNLFSSEAFTRYLLFEVYHDLNEEEREALRVIALLDEDITSRETIEEVMQAGSRLSILLSLQEKHLLAVRDTAQGKRYGMHQAVRAFFVELMSARERQHLFLRIARYFANQDHPLEAAYYYAQAGQMEQAATWLPEQPREYLNRGKVRWLNKLVEAFQSQDRTRLSPSVRLRLITIQSAIYHFQRRFQEAINLLEPLLAESISQEQKADIAYALARIYEHKRESQPARDYYQLALESYRFAGHEAGVCKALCGLGWALFRAGQLNQALDYHRQALEIAKKLDAPLDIAKAKFGLGSTLIHLKSLDEAKTLLEESISVFETTGDQRLLGMAVGNLGLIAGLQGDLEGQRRSYEKAMAILESVGELTPLQVGHHNMIYVYLTLGEIALAQEHALSLLELAQLSSEIKDLCRAYAGLAMVYTAQGALEKASDYAGQAYALAQTLSDGVAKGAALRAMGALQLRLGNQGWGTELLKQSAAIFQALSAWDELAIVQKLMDAR